MIAPTNPYAPPRDEAEVPQVHPKADTGTITCTVRLEVDDMSAWVTQTFGKVRLAAPVVLFAMGLVSGASMGTPLQLAHALGLGILGWALWTLVFRALARRSLANKSDAERTVTFTFSAEAVEVTTATTYSRSMWPAVHRFVEGPKTFIFYMGESIVQIVPKRALRSDEVDALRAMLTSRVTPRKKPASPLRIVVLWLALFVLYMFVWQFFQPAG
jgi:hypothetical protein